MNFFFRKQDLVTIGTILFVALMLLGLRSWVQNAANNDGPAVDFDQVQPKNYVFVVDINKAGWAEIALLPGIGEKLAMRIIAFREKAGRIEDAEQLLEVKGIGPKKLKSIQPFISVENLAKEPQSELGV